MKRSSLLIALSGLLSHYCVAQSDPPTQAPDPVPRKEYVKYYPDLPPVPTPIFPVFPLPDVDKRLPKDSPVTPNTLSVSSNPPTGGGIMPTASPEVAAINHLQDIAVNLFTGTPLVPIPLYTLQEAGLSVPISLNYNASGLQGASVSGWTGSNWELSYGGILTRLIKGVPDEGKIDFDNTSSSWSAQIPREGFFIYGGGVSIASPTTNDDTEPDVFFVNLNGASYRFSFDAYHKAHFYPDADIQVVAQTTSNTDDPTGTVQIFTTFTFTLPDGTKYVFTNDNTEATMEVEVKYAQANGIYPLGTNFLNYKKNQMITNAWYLKKIVSPYYQGNEINFTYNRVAYSYFKLAEQSLPNTTCPTAGALPKEINKVYVLGALISTITSRNSQIKFNDGYLSCSTDHTISPPVTVCHLTAPARLDIDDWTQYPQNQSPAKRLLTMQVSDVAAIGGPNLTFSFSYGDFVSTNTDLPTSYTLSDVGTSHQHRLRLTQVSLPDNTHYQLSYVGDATGYNFKTRLSMGLDHWGFFNGNEGNNSLSGLVGKDAYITCGTVSNRESDISYMQYGALTKISHSLGSKVMFDYEANRAANYGGGVLDVGGLRIQRIHYVDSLTGLETIKTYNYLLGNGTSSGFMALLPIYHYEDNTALPQVYSGLYNQLLSDVGRPNVGYSQVTETLFDNSTNTTGKNISYFDQDPTQLHLYSTQYYCGSGGGGCGYASLYWIHKFQPIYDFRNGNLLKSEIYNTAGSLLSSQQYIYSYRNGDSLKIDSTYARKIWRQFGTITQTDNYYPVFRKYRVEKTIAMVYSQDGSGTPMVNVSQYVYKDKMPMAYRSSFKGKHNFVVKTSSTDSYGYPLESYQKYVADYFFGSDSVYIAQTCYNSTGGYDCSYYLHYDHQPTGNDANGIYMAASAGIKAGTVESFSKRNGKVTNANYQTYYQNGHAGFGSPNAVYQAETLPLPTLNEAIYSHTGGTDDVIHDTNYGYSRLTYTGYNTFRLPQTVQYQFGRTDYIAYDTQDVLAISVQRNGSASNQQTTTYDYATKFLGISKQTAPNGLFTQYQYDGAGRLKTVTDKDGKVLKRNIYKP